jgi:ABC-type nitrate/sulfonate/bicarbonate transport system substrate-binding protein
VNRKRTPLLVVVAALVTVVIAACGSSGDSGAGSKNASAGTGPTTIRYQVTPGSLDTIEFASYLGYLPGLKIKQVGTVLGGPADIQAVATNSSDVGGAFDGSVAAAIAAGAKIKAVVGYYGSNKLTFGGVYVKSNSSIRTAKDLIGKSVGVNTLGANATQVTDLWLAKQGLTPAQIKQVNFVVVSPTSAAEALQTGRLDAAFLSFATRQLALKNGGVRELMTDTGLLGPYTGGAEVLRTSFIARYPKETTEIVSALAKTIHWLQVTPRAQVIKVAEKIATQHGRSDDNWISSWRSQGVLENGGYIKPIDFSRWTQAMELTGQLRKGQVSLSQLYTDAFNPYTPH